mmetsp:Transcript_9614/g.10575  ORF Transcript_9614/g.10575 Transcript_9614/m.10575 type:complete len:190 (+) Transcript_9614:2-571(+)
MDTSRSQIMSRMVDCTTDPQTEEDQNYSQGAVVYTDSPLKAGISRARKIHGRLIDAYDNQMDNPNSVFTSQQEAISLSVYGNRNINDSFLTKSYREDDTRASSRGRHPSRIHQRKEIHSIIDEFHRKKRDHRDLNVPSVHILSKALLVPEDYSEDFVSNNLPTPGFGLIENEFYVKKKKGKKGKKKKKR